MQTVRFAQLECRPSDSKIGSAQTCSEEQSFRRFGALTVKFEDAACRPFGSIHGLLITGDAGALTGLLVHRLQDSYEATGYRLPVTGYRCQNRSSVAAIGTYMRDARWHEGASLAVCWQQGAALVFPRSFASVVAHRAARARFAPMRVLFHFGRTLFAMRPGAA